MSVTDYFSWHPVFEAQRAGSYEEKFVVNRINEINRQIGTGYTKGANRLIEENTITALKKHQDDAITKLMDHVIKETKAVKWRLNDCSTRQLIEQNKPLEMLTHKSVPKYHSENQLQNLNHPNSNIHINKINRSPKFHHHERLR